MRAFVIRITLLIACTVLAVYSLEASQWAPFATAILGIFWSIDALIHRYRMSEQKVTHLLDAVDNNDGSFRFPEKGTDSAEVNAALNRIAGILSRACADVVRQEKYFEHILGVVNTGILVINTDGHIERTNRRALELLGMEACTHLRRIAGASPELARLLADGIPGERLQAEYSNGAAQHTFNIHISAVTIQNRELKIVAIDDIDRELDNREVDSWTQMIRILTHEIMNSLSPITSLSDSMLHNGSTALSADVRQGLETISATGRSLSEFVTSYRKLLHPIVPDPALIDVLPLLERMVNLARNFSTGCRIGIVKCAPDLMLYADENLIARVLLNLLKNAVQAATQTDNGAVSISAYSSDADEVVIEVSNNGPQISGDIADRIFLPFFTTKPDGTGIGLSLSKQIMRASGGTLTLLPYSSTKHDTTFALKFH